MGFVAHAVAGAAAERALWTLAGEARLLAGQALLDNGRPTARARLVEALLHARAHGLEDLEMLAAAALVRLSAVRAFDLEDAQLFAGLARAGLELTGDDGLLRAEGRVVRSLPHGDEFDIGLQFAPLTELDRDRLVDALIRRVLSEDRA